MNEIPVSRRAVHDELLSLCQRLVRVPSENPGGDTTAVAELLTQELQHPGIEVQRHEPQPGCVNLVAVVRGAHAGPRVVLNGHLDTYPVGPREGWTHDPFAGERVGGRLYGRGAGDMKAGVAVLVHVMRELAQQRAQLRGELVLSLVADEETGGRWGTTWLLDHVAEVRGDHLLNADAGHTRVVRFGEKGLMWLRLSSMGRAGHGAHTHLGDNAIESLIAAVSDLLALRTHEATLPHDILAAMVQARPVSEQEGGAGEFDNLRGITVNLGALHGGDVANLIPSKAHALIDLRYPPGMTRDAVLRLVSATLARHDKVRFEMVPGSDTEPNVTPPRHPLVQTALKHARRLTAPEAVANMRVGMTDARLFRHRGMPAVVYGPRAFNMGGVDEHVLEEDVVRVFEVHLATAGELLGLA